ncbi:MAG: hypothetical protein E8D49_03475 [Nitrospira sp.]|nr:MAG: hypothetical protein E8D49_03475 [Nitrospira sp.]
MIGTRHLYYVDCTRGKDLRELKASVAYKYTAITHELCIQELPNDWRRCGSKPFHLPVCVMLKEEQHEQSAALTGFVLAH